MRRFFSSIRDATRRGIATLDRWFNRLYTWRYNPLYHSGALVVGCFLILGTGGLSKNGDEKEQERRPKRNVTSGVEEHASITSEER